MAEYVLNQMWTDQSNNLSDKASTGVGESVTIDGESRPSASTGQTSSAADVNPPANSSAGQASPSEVGSAQGGSTSGSHDVTGNQNTGSHHTVGGHDQPTSHIQDEGQPASERDASQPLQGAGEDAAPAGGNAGAPEHQVQPSGDDPAVEQATDSDTADQASTDQASADNGTTDLQPEEHELGESVLMDWYILKVQSNRERSIAEALQRKVAVEGLDEYFGQVIVPTEKVTEFKGGKKKIVERKLWPGYIVVQMHINDDTWFAVRETSGIGDFTGAAGKPTPMQPHEVARIVQTDEEETEEAPRLAIKFAVGDKVKVKEGNFENFEGEVGSIDEASGKVTIMINIFGRSTPVELEYWQVEAV